MFTRKNWQFVALLTIFAIVLVSCGQATPTAVEQPTEKPVVDTQVADVPTEVQVCALLAVGPDQGWDRTFLESFDRVVSAQPVAGVLVNH